MRARSAAACALALLLPAAPGASSYAAEFPNRPLRFIVPVTPGGGVDTMARAIGRQLTERLAQQVVVDNRAGGGGSIGAEITGMEGDVITMQEIFVFEKRGVTQEGKVIGRFRATGVRPKCAERLKASGIHLPAEMFEGITEVR